MLEYVVRGHMHGDGIRGHMLEDGVRGHMIGDLSTD